MKKSANSIKFLILMAIMAFPVLLRAQPKAPISQWKNKTILFVGAHPDDDGGSHGLFAMLEDHGNDVYVLILTSGNVGTKDPKISRKELAKIRRQEEVDALAEVGVPEDHYINLGYTDGMVDFANHKDVVRRIVYWIRKLQPDVYIGFDPGNGFKYWRKTDHRAATRLGTDAARAAEWPLLFHGQITHKGLEGWWIPEYLFFGGLEKYNNVKLDITSYVDRVVKSQSKYISQYSSGWYDYKGPKISDYPKKEAKKYMDKIHKIVHRNDENGKTYEVFRYYKGKPDGIGRHRTGSGISPNLELQKSGSKKAEEGGN
jgi:LmbE family N-acetylglucosaminyl deacetylase